MANVNNWLKCFDEIKESKVKPFKKHLVSELLNEHELNSYAVLQSAFVLFNGDLSGNQEILYKFYLPALSKELKLAEIMSQAQDVNDEILKEYVKLLEDKGLLLTFLLDVLVFSRLDNSVNEDFKEVLNSFCYSLSIKSDDVNQLIYLSNHILGIETDEKPELTDVFFNLIKNPIWMEFFAKTVTKDNILDINGGIWCIDEAIELLEGDILWKNSVIIFEGTGRLDHFNGTFTSEKASIISPVITVNDVTVDMDTVVIKGEYDADKKITALDINASENVIIKNSKINTVNARAFSICQHSISGRFENTDFAGCGNEALLGGAVKFVEKIHFNNCNFNDCKAQVGGALFFKIASGNDGHIIDCNFKNCLSTTEWSEGVNAGIIFIDYAYSSNKIFVNCYVQGDLTISFIESITSDDSKNIMNSYVDGFVNYSSNSRLIWSFLSKQTKHSTGCTVDSKSLVLSGKEYDQFCKKIEGIKNYESLIHEYN